MNNDSKLLDAVAKILDVEKRFNQGEFGSGDEAEDAAVKAVEKILLNLPLNQEGAAS